MRNWLLQSFPWIQNLFYIQALNWLPLDVHSPVGISTSWEVLGPFQIGTREATWGADPLEYIGGFRAIDCDLEATYHSSLGANGTVGWKLMTAEQTVQAFDASQVRLTIAFPQVDWKFLQSFYGWAALQYQAWARGEILVRGDEPRTVILYTDFVLEFWIDGIPYFGGDFYAYRRAPLVVRLVPGVHRMDVRIIRDVRAMGGVGDPDVSINVRVELSRGGLAVQHEKLLLPDWIEDHLNEESLASVPVRNDGAERIDVVGLESVTDNFVIHMLTSSPLHLVPDQSRPLPFKIRLLTDNGPKAIQLRVLYSIAGSSVILSTPNFSSPFPIRKIHEPQKITFRHPSGVVNYAVLTPPPLQNNGSILGQSLPVLLNLHGAGLKADSDQVRHMLDSASSLQAWTLFPTGGTTWSGDDWHTWGFADIEAAVSSIPGWIAAKKWKGSNVNVNELYVSGHSNGGEHFQFQRLTTGATLTKSGQGTWFIMSHQPDKVVAAAPVSGYSSIQAYVPYQFWHEMDPNIASVLQNSLASYRHELLADNFASIPILQQHGSDDDNVPAYHSRRLSQLAFESGNPSNYVELPNEGHWFDGIMVTEPLREFYRNISKSAAVKKMLPEKFKIVVPNSGDMGSRGGIQVDQLISPDQLGTINFISNPSSSTWTITTSNVLRFHFTAASHESSMPNILIVDGSVLDINNDKRSSGHRYIIRSSQGSWTSSHEESWKTISQRYGAQLGPMDAILRTRGSFLILAPSPSVSAAASQIARNLFQYFGADSKIVECQRVPPSQIGNVISLLIGPTVSFPRPILPFVRFLPTGISLLDALGYEHSYEFEEGLGMVFLRPLVGERLEMVVWGFDEAGLHQASRLLPMLTGVGQPDFVILSKKCSWKGAAGVLAMGFFDHKWRVSRASFLS